MMMVRSGDGDDDMMMMGFLGRSEILLYYDTISNISKPKHAARGRGQPGRGGTIGVVILFVKESPDRDSD